LNYARKRVKIICDFPILSTLKIR